MALSAQQRKVLKVFLARARAKGASPKITKALVEAGVVESHLTNLHGGDRDSQGVLQQRPSQGWGTVAQTRDPARAADKFIDAAKLLRAKYGSAGALAQAVQRSAFPERYQQQSSYVDQLLGGAGKVGSGSGAAKAQAASTSTPDLAGRQKLVLAFIHRNDGPSVTAPHTLGDLQSQVKALAPIVTPGKPTASKGSASAPSSSGTLPTGVGTFEGKKVAAWIVPALKYARAHGWKGTVTSGYRSFADQQRIYNSGVRPAAKPGTSNHEGTDFPRGAIDTTDAATLSRILRSSPYASKLIYAGTKDPVHFSHPHSGGY